MQFVIGVYYAAAHSFISYDVPTTTGATTTNTLKKVLYRAVSAEGLADNVASSAGHQTINCIDTSGQTFAIWLNVFYLGPLMYLFMRFFYRSYIRRATPKPTGKASGNRTVQAIEGAFVDAAKGVDRGINGNTGRISRK